MEQGSEAADIARGAPVAVADFERGSARPGAAEVPESFAQEDLEGGKELDSKGSKDRLNGKVRAAQIERHEVAGIVRGVAPHFCVVQWSLPIPAARRGATPHRLRHLSRR